MAESSFCNATQNPICLVDETLPEFGRLHFKLTLKLPHPCRQPVVRGVHGRHHVLVVNPGRDFERWDAEDLCSDLISASLQAVFSFPFERADETSFVRRQALTALGSGVLAFLWVAEDGVPALSDAMILILLSAPLSIWLLRATRRLFAAEALTSATFIAAGLIAALSGGALHQTEFLWFVLRSQRRNVAGCSLI